MLEIIMFIVIGISIGTYHDVSDERDGVHTTGVCHDSGWYYWGKCPEVED